MRAVAASLALLSGCSWLFQDRMSQPYNGRSEPQCSTSSGWGGVDLAFAGLNAIGGFVAAGDEQLTDEERNAYLAGGILWGVVHLASAVTGFAWASKCSKAYSEWNEGASPMRRVEDNAERERLARELGEVREVKERTPVEKPKPRGFFCAASTSAGFCAREKADCIAARDAAIAAVADLSECGLVETAHCFDTDGRERCFPTAELCTARSNGVACEDRK